MLTLRNGRIKDGPTPVKAPHTRRRQPLTARLPSRPQPTSILPTRHQLLRHTKASTSIREEGIHADRQTKSRRRDSTARGKERKRKSKRVKNFRVCWWRRRPRASFLAGRPFFSPRTHPLLDQPERDLQHVPAYVHTRTHTYYW